MKKALALILSLMMIMSVCVVSAEHVFVDSIPAEGVVFYDDFEDWEGNMLNARMAAGGIWANISSYAMAEVDGNHVYNTSLSSGHTFAYMGNFPGTINTGRVKLSFDLSGAMYAARMANVDGKLPSTYGSIWTTANNVLFAMANAGDGVGYFFARGNYFITESDLSADDIFEVDLTTATNVAVILDYAGEKIEYYLDDKLVYTASRRPAPINASTGEIDIVSDNGKGEVFGFDEENGTYPSLYLDNIKLEILGAGSGGGEGGEGGSTYVPSDELEEPVVLMEHDFEDVTELDANEWKKDGGVAYTIADGVFSFDGVQNQAIYALVPANVTVTATDVYELSYDIMSDREGGTAKNYFYRSGNDMAIGSYKPGTGFGMGIDMAGTNLAAPDLEKWYTVKVEWCYDPANTYTYYSIWDGETKIGDRLVLGAKGPQGNDIPAFNPPKEFMFWNENMPSYNLDNIVFRQLPVGYNPKVYQPQVWTQVGGEGAYVLVDADTVISNGDVLTAEAYAAPGCQLILAAYDANDELMATKVDTAPIRDFYQVVADAEEDGFTGAAYVKAFIFGTGDGFKPITICYNSAAR